MSKYLLMLSCLVPLITGTLYSVSPDFKVTYEQSYNELAHATYDQKSNEQGWNYLYVNANEKYGLLDQHRGAGFIQGFVTYKQIWNAFNNLAKSILHGPTLNQKIQNFIDTQVEYIEEMTDKFPRDLFWQHIKAYFQQLKYMYRGYLSRLHLENRLDLFIGFSQFYYLTNVGDLQDLIPAFDTQGVHSKLGNCNGYAKLVDKQIWIGHSTHNIYPFMLRIFKSYNFPTRNTEVGSQRITFSSRPGDLISKDDFYVLSSGLKVLQTSLSNYNKDNYKLLNPASLPSWLRLCVAVNLARDASEWVDYFFRFSSGTHNNQWMIIDSKKIDQKKNVVVFADEGFNIFEVSDMTEMLFDNGYVASYNIPFSKTVYKKLGYQKSPFDYDNEPRAVIFRKYNPFMTDEESMKKWLITNNEDDPRVGLAPRYDVVETGASAFGLVDCKIITPNTEKSNFIWAISGPSTSNGRFPAFNWDAWSNTPHEGLPKIFNFDWQKVWIDNEVTTSDKKQNIAVQE